MALGRLRSMLYAPGSEPRKMRKALDAGADAVIYDLEDSVADDSKAAARAAVAAMLDELAGEVDHPPVFVRVNSGATGLQEQDLEMVVRPGLTGIKVPKTESVDELRTLDAACTKLESARGMRHRGTVVIPGIESARGLMSLDVIAAGPRVWCLSFGAVDFALDLGTEPTSEGSESLVALSLLAIGSRAACLYPPIDSAWSDLSDENGLRRTASLARRLGFQGKAVIHPGQISVVNEVFSATAAELRRAKEIVARGTDAVRAGRGAIQVGGALVDAAHLKRAQAVLELHDRRRT